MYNKECYQKYKAKRIQKSLDYYYEHRNNPEFMQKRRESDKRYYRKSSKIVIETGVKVSFL
jgi:hypothetical protein